MIYICKPCQRELEGLPQVVREDLADALARLETRQKLSMPLSRPMPSMGKGVHELRLRDQSGTYRVIYAIVRTENVYLLHIFKKTTQQTSLHDIKVTKKRLREI